MNVKLPKSKARIALSLPSIKSDSDGSIVIYLLVHLDASPNSSLTTNIFPSLSALGKVIVTAPA